MTTEKPPGWKPRIGRPPIHDSEVIKRLILERKDEMLQEDGYSIVSRSNPLWAEISSKEECSKTAAALYTFVTNNKQGIREEIDPDFLEKRERIRSTRKRSMDTSTWNRSTQPSDSKVFKSRSRMQSVNSTRSVGESSTECSEKNERMNRIPRRQLKSEDKDKYKKEKNLERWGDMKPVMDSSKTQFIWTIKNFSSRYLATGEILKSTIFNTGGHNEDQWRLLLYPKGICELDKDSVHIYLELIRNSGQIVALDVIFSIVKPGTNETTRDKKVTKRVFDQSGMKHGIKNFMKYTEISSFLEDDSLDICCEFRPTPGYARNRLESNSFDGYDQLPIDVESTKIEDEVLDNPVDLLPRLCDQLWQEFENPKHSDAVIIVRNDNLPVDIKYHVHKFILQVRSSKFSGMFERMTKNSTCEIIIQDIKPAVVKKMLQFIYTDSVNDFEEMAGDLLVAAYRYNLNALQALCEQVLFEKLEVSNAVGTWVLAETWGFKLLQDRVAKFIKSNLKEITETADYGALEKSRPELVLHLVRAMASQKA